MKFLVSNFGVLCFWSGLAVVAYVGFGPLGVGLVLIVFGAIQVLL